MKEVLQAVVDHLSYGSSFGVIAAENKSLACIRQLSLRRDKDRILTISMELSITCKLYVSCKVRKNGNFTSPSDDGMRNAEVLKNYSICLSFRKRFVLVVVHTMLGFI